jgi:CDGSH-type Zn-finger protein
MEPASHLAYDGHDGPVKEPRRVTPLTGGPVLVEGPVEVQLPDGRIARSDRPVVAVCTCRRTRVPPWCDTSHRQKVRDDG